MVSKREISSCLLYSKEGLQNCLQVVIPGLAHSSPGAGTYIPNKVCRTVDEAQNYAAEYVLMSLGTPYDGTFIPFVNDFY